jgi:Na+-translocating ferredoxin:NAD+ oxidoreductase RnfG subunit
MDGDTAGLVFLGSTQGYGDCIEYAAGIDNKGRIVDITVLYENETAGIGDVIASRAFLEKFKTKIPNTVSGATVSTKALIDAVKNDVERYGEYLP